MAILSDINGALLKMDPASFQQLGDELLKKIYHPINVESRGSMIGKVKTRKGSPDTVLVIPEGKILVEYTTLSSSENKQFITKLRGDISSCLDVRKTKIPINEIVEIILFANQRIAINIQDDLKEEFKSIHSNVNLCFFSLDDIALKIKDYPQLMSDYLRIMDYSNLIELDTYIEKSSSQKLSLPIPLDNTYLEVENFSLSKGLEEIVKNDILVISGEAGMGKTRYAIELSKLYAREIGAKTYVLIEKNKNVREILDQIDYITPYIFLIDDANRTSIWDETIEFYKNSTHNNIKIIATVRDYALEKVVSCCSELKAFKHLQVPSTTDEFIIQILESLGITNPEWHKRIISITRHNIRLAIMCAQLAIHGKKYNDLINVESVYDAYYKIKFKELTVDCDNALYIKVLSIISFYKIVDLSEESLLDQIQIVFNISKFDFVSVCKILERLEFVDLTEDNIVTIPDQNFSNYIFYQCFFVLKELSLINLFEKLYFMHDRLNDSIFSVWNCFHQTTVIEYSKTAVLTAWKAISKLDDKLNDQLDFLNVFGALIPFDTFVFVNNIIHKKGSTTCEISVWGCDSVVSILANFSHSEKEDIHNALILLADYLEINPNQFEQAKQVLSEKWVYDDSDYLYSYKRSSIIIDSLIKVSYHNGMGLKLACEILPCYLKFIYQLTRSRGRNIQFGRYPIYVTQELKSNRIKVWGWILENIHQMDITSFVEKLYSNYYEVVSIAKELIVDEIPYINKAIESFPLDKDFNLCCALGDFEKRINKLIGKGQLVIVWNNANKLYKLDQKISGKPKRYVTDLIGIEKKNISTIVTTKSVSEIKILLDEIVEIANLNKSRSFIRISFVIEDLMNKDVSVAFQVWQYSIDKGYDFIVSRVINAYLKSNSPIEHLIDFVKKQNEKIKSILLLDIICNVGIPSAYISEHEFFKTILCCQRFPYKLDFLVKKFFSEEVYVKKVRSTMAVILIRIRKGMEISDTEDFLRDFSSHYTLKFNLVEKVYIYQIKRDKSYDYKHDLFKDLLSLDSDFWLKCCKEINSFVKTCCIEPYNFICSLDNYSQIIESTILFYARKSWISYDEEDNLYSFFSNINDEKLIKFIDNMIEKYCNDKNITSILFDIVFRCMGSNRIHHFITFITHNNSVEDFKLLRIRPQIMYGGDSFASAVKSNLDFVSSLLMTIKSLGNLNYLEHIVYLQETLGNLEKEYKSELKRGHKHRLYDL